VTEPRIGERPIRRHGLNEKSEEIVLEVAGRILGAGLVRGESAFTPAYRIWNPRTATDLMDALNQVLADGGGDYHTRLPEELRGAPDDAIRLAAELQYLMFLGARDIRPKTKRERVEALLELLPHPVVLPSEFVQAFDSGVFNLGIGFKVQGWRQLRGLYTFVQAWTGTAGLPREVASYDPWAFKRFVVHAGGTRAMRNLLLYLAYPDSFEPITSQQHKNDIRSAFTAQLGIEKTDDVDRDLLAIRNRLETEAEERITFYSDDLMPRWRKGTTGSKPVAARPVPVATTRKAWLVRGSSVRGEDLIPRWLAEKICSLPATRLGDARPGMSREEITKLVEAGYASDSYNERNTKVDEFYNFLSRMDADDLVATTSQEEMRLGRISGRATLMPGRDGLADLVRPVDWATGAPVDLPDLAPSLLARLRVQQDVVDLTRDLPQLAPLLDLAGTANEEEVEEAEERASAPWAVLPRVESALAQELHLPEQWLQEIVAVLRDRRQLVLYGPPGTGKTHLALRMAAYLTKDPQNVTLVQFHPTYSYEDFFEGYRPVQAADNTVELALKPGPFRRLVDRARNDQTPAVHPDHRRAQPRQPRDRFRRALLSVGVPE
jgi:5-methylcytosine-specific restriction protein B